jgi:hypothetical protein
MNTVEEQMQMLDLELRTNKPKEKFVFDGNIPLYKPSSPIFSERMAIVQGSFTGAVVQATIQTRQGRPLLASGIRIFDDMVLNEVKKTKLQNNK